MDWIVLAGVGVMATMFMDVVAWMRMRIWGIAGLDYALVGRWLGHLMVGRICHRTIITSPTVVGERVLGWFAHYAIGGGLAVGLGLLVGPKVALYPSAPIQIGYGATTVLVPFLLMLPCFGFGFFARKTPNPALARWRSVIAHGSFGTGLFLSVLVVDWLRKLPEVQPV
ncbi:DUF2938 family protein [uncultured Pelagimonas sp.]|uniref:DUF2938 family protein n=1 Tax=uncultured Pelagimonas sp. TaxID=1618102 RepID=UPI0026016751|nr:DUF2938 family protein [uncultured Pelagimonas sp.]